jgi:FeoB-associated Cys-rich membrane protein
MQLVLTLTLIAIAAAYVLYSIAQTWLSDAQGGACGGGCKSCPQGKQHRNKKGEPVTLVPLQDFNR